jgi:hypothetical protein
MLLHEWTHGVFAWLFGYKKNPFNIYYGDWTLLKAWELIDYKTILQEGKGWVMSVIAISPIALGIFLYLFGIIILSIKRIRNRKILWYFLFWFTLSNFGQVFDYIPSRTFVGYQDGLLRGDIGHFLQGLNISPWIIFIPGMMFIILGILEIFVYEVPKLYVVMNIPTSKRKNYLFIILIYLFCWYGMAGFQYSFLSKIICGFTQLMLPVIFILCHPMKNRVKDKIIFYSNIYKNNQVGF